MLFARCSPIGVNGKQIIDALYFSRIRYISILRLTGEKKLRSFSVLTSVLTQRY